jgi:protocatechuate 3,4-dioxygenase beta subunit
MRRLILIIGGLAIFLLVAIDLCAEPPERPPLPPDPVIAGPPSPPAGSAPVPAVVPAVAPDGPAAGTPAEAPAAPRITLSVTVKDAAGTPVAGAAVMVIPHGVYRADGGYGSLELPPEARYTAETDAAGQVVFDHPGEHLDGVHLVAVSADGGNAAVSQALYLRKPGRHEAELGLVRATSVRGRVKDADGRRIGDAQVALVVHDVTTSWSSSIGPYGFRLSPVRLEHGEFEFPPVPPSDRMTISLVAATAEGYLPAEYEFPHDRDRPDVVVVRMLRPVRVAGRIVDAEGRPLAGARVMRIPGDLFAETTTQTTGADGVFAFDDLPEDGAVVSVGSAAGVPFRVSVGRVHGREKDLGDLLVGTAGIIEGVVVDDDGVPVPGVGVRVHRREFPGTIHSATTDADGRFSVADLGDGEHTLLVREQGGRGFAAREGRVAGVKGGAKDVRIVLSGGMLITVNVNFPPGQEPGPDPAYFHVQLDRAGTPDEPFMQELWERGRDRIRLRMAKAGRFALCVTMGGYRPVREQVEVSPERETVVTVTLARE